MFNQTSNQLNQQLMFLAREKLITPDELEEAYRLTGKTADLKQWHRFLNSALLSLGGAFLVAGIFFFFAWNWDQIGRLTKFGSIGVLILGAALYAIWKQLDTLPAKISLSASAALIGVLFSVMGQEYQSPADYWVLFALWALFSAGWVIIGRFSPLWFGWFALVNLTTYLWLDQSGGLNFFQNDSRFLFNLNLIALLNGGILLAWELFLPRMGDWANGRWLPRTLSLPLIGASTWAMMWIIFDPLVLDTQGGITLASVLLIYGGIIAATISVYGYKKQDLFMVTVALFSLITVITSKVIERFTVWIDDDVALFLIGLIVLALGWLAYQFLRMLQKKQTISEVLS